MSRVFQVAKREFLATTMTKGFIIGAFLVPGISLALIPLIIILVIKATPPPVEGAIGVIDRSGAVVEPLEHYFSPDVAEARVRAESERAAEIASEFAGGMMGGTSDAQRRQMDAAIKMAVTVPKIDIVRIEADADLDAHKQALREDPDRLALAVIAADAVVKPDDQPDFGGYELFVVPGQDDRVLGDIRAGLTESIRQARFAASGADRARVESLLRVNAPRTQEVTDQGERGSTEELRTFLPFVFILLLMMSVMVGGQYLMTTTIEEKSSRVVEVLLSALSPMQLMSGKIIGQLAVGLTLLVIYSGLGTGLLGVFSLLDLIGVVEVVYLFLFFLLAYFMFGSLMAAVGAAVNDMREAQSLMMPVIMMIIIPYILWLPISRDPNSTFATVLSFLPPVSPFVIMMRISSSTPPPTWQVLAAIGVNIVGAYFCLRLAAKVFRVGLLMFGKPPNFKTLIHWIRIA